MKINVRDMIVKHGRGMPDAWKKQDVGYLLPIPTQQDIDAAIRGFEQYGFGKQASTASGAFGSYLQLTRNIGAKVLRGVSFSSSDEARESSTWKDAEKEADNLIKAKELLGNLVPQFLYLGVTSWQEKYYIVLLVQHIDGKMLSDLDKGEDVQSLRSKVLAAASKYNTDLHEGNIMMVRDGGVEHLYVVDWGIAKF